MSQEIQVRQSLLIRNPPNGLGLYYQSQPQSFNTNQANANGPTPGAITAITSGNGTEIIMSALTTPGMMHIMNYDQVNFVRLGLVISSVFYPFAQILAAETYVWRIDPTILTANTAAAQLWIKADTLACKVLVNIFDA